MQIIKQAIEKVVEELSAQGGSALGRESCVVEFVVERPKDESHGDWSSNIALAVFAKSKIQNPKSQTNSKNQIQNEYKNPRELAEKVLEKLREDKKLGGIVKKIEVAGAGFINFTLKTDYLWRRVGEAMEDGYGRNESLAGKKIMVEYTDPNPFKEFHIGHLMSNTIGESIARLAEVQGAEVKRANYQGDVGLHVAKSVWGMQAKMQNEKVSLVDLQGQALKVRQAFMGQAYALGAGKYEENETEKNEMNVMNREIYEKSNNQLNELYEMGREWSLEYFETIYTRLGTEFDEYFFESEAGLVGLEVIDEGLERGILEEGEGGAVVYKGEKDGLHTRVFRNALGLATYEGKELGLAKTKYGRYPYDLSYIVTADEITEYFKVLLKVMEQLYPELAAKTTHMPHGMMKLKTGKMSSRTGKIVTGEGLLDELKEVVLAKMGEREVENKELVADQISVGALKWTVLKQQVGGDIVYEPAKMTNLEGDTGPYVQYTHARCASLLKKSKIQTVDPTLPMVSLGAQELSIVRWLDRYPEVVVEAGSRYIPHKIANYVYELATRFNSFYNKHQIIGSEQESQRVELTSAVANVLVSGLGVLGIEAPASM